MTVVNTDSYAVVAEARGHRVLWYRMFGSYQGEWLLFSADDELYYLWSGSYGSCSGCDALQSHFSYGNPVEHDSKHVQDFIQDYDPFIEMKPEAALRIAEREGSIFSVLPRNRREWYDESWNNEVVGRQLALIVKHEQGVISAQEILEIDNQEIRREAIEKLGPEKFVSTLGASCLDREGEDELYVVLTEVGREDFSFLYLKDPSTSRRYVLRVNPEHKTVRSARASTFGMSEAQFVLAQET